MRVGSIQSCYIPWRGYFDFIDSVDLFVIADDLPFSSGGFRNRNRIVGSAGAQWLTLPVHAGGRPLISEVRIAAPFADWTRQHHKRMLHALGRTPFWPEAREVWTSGLGEATDNLSVINDRLLRQICDRLGIDTPIVRSETLGVGGSKTDRVVELMRVTGARTYLTGPSALAYLKVDRLKREGIAVEIKQYRYPPYPQRRLPFEDSVSIIDTIANLGLKGARRALASSLPAKVLA